MAVPALPSGARGAKMMAAMSAAPSSCRVQGAVAVDRLGAVVIAQFRRQRVPQAGAGVVGKFGQVERDPG